MRYQWSSGSEECSRNVVVDDLDHDQITAVGHDVKGGSLHIGVLVGLPSQILLGQDGVGGLAGLLGDGLDGFGAIDGFLRADGRGQAVDLELATTAHTSVEEQSSRRLKPVHGDCKDGEQKNKREVKEGDRRGARVSSDTNGNPPGELINEAERRQITIETRRTRRKSWSNVYC
jgi:hypothetical protein